MFSTQWETFQNVSHFFSYIELVGYFGNSLPKNSSTTVRTGVPDPSGKAHHDENVTRHHSYYYVLYQWKRAESSHTAEGISDGFGRDFSHEAPTPVGDLNSQPQQQVRISPQWIHLRAFKSPKSQHDFDLLHYDFVLLTSCETRIWMSSFVRGQQGVFHFVNSASPHFRFDNHALISMYMTDILLDATMKWDAFGCYSLWSYLQLRRPSKNELLWTILELTKNVIESSYDDPLLDVVVWLLLVEFCGFTVTLQRGRKRIQTPILKSSGSDRQLRRLQLQDRRFDLYRQTSSIKRELAWVWMLPKYSVRTVPKISFLPKKSAYQAVGTCAPFYHRNDMEKTLHWSGKLVMDRRLYSNFVWMGCWLSEQRFSPLLMFGSFKFSSAARCMKHCALKPSCRLGQACPCIDATKCLDWIERNVRNVSVRSSAIML